MKESLYCTRCGMENKPKARACLSCRKSLIDSFIAKHKPRVLPPHDFKRPIEPKPPLPKRARQPDPTFSSPNFIVRHWRGENSLGVSFWKIVVVLSIALVMLPSIVREISESQRWGLHAQGALMLGFYLLRPVVWVWQLVGLSRSALAHKRRGGSLMWAVVAMAIVAVSAVGLVFETTFGNVPIIREGFKMVRGVDDVPEYSLRLVRNNTELELVGGLRLGVADEVENLLDRTRTVRVIHLDSPGGRFGEAKRLADLIEQRNLITYTSGTCASACVLAFLAGHQRYLGDQGRIGLRSTAVSGYAVSGAVHADTDFTKALTRVGASPSFIERAISDESQDVWYPDAEALKQEHVIDAVITPSAVRSTPTSPTI